jgi:hypothetical protein
LKLGNPVKSMLIPNFWNIRKSIWGQTRENIKTKNIWIFINDEIYDKIINLIPNTK